MWSPCKLSLLRKDRQKRDGRNVTTTGVSNYLRVSTGIIIRQERIVRHIQRAANLLLLRTSVLFQEHLTAKLRQQQGRGTQYTLLR